MKSRRRSRRRRSRRNPAGGFWPGVLGFFVVPIGAGLVVRAANEAGVGVSSCEAAASVTGVVQGSAALGLWAGRDAVSDPGWRSFMLGGAIASAIAAVLVPTAIVVAGRPAGACT